MTTAVRTRSGQALPARNRPRKPFPWFKYLSLAPLIAFFLVLVAFPVLQLLWMSVGRVRLAAGNLLWTFTGTENYEAMFSDETFAVSLINSAVFIFFTVVLTLILGVALALATDRIVRTQKFVQNILIWPAIIAPVVISVVWLLILSPQIGFLNRVLITLGLPPQAWLGEPVGAMASIIIVDVWHWTPIVFLFVYTALRGLDSSVLEAASVDGASYAKTVHHIVLPLLMPAIMGAAAIRVVMGVKAFDEMYLMTFGGPGTATTVITIYLRNVFFGSFQYGYGAALSVTVVALVTLTLILAFAFQALMRRSSRG